MKHRRHRVEHFKKSFCVCVCLSVSRSMCFMCEGFTQPFSLIQIFCPLFSTQDTGHTTIFGHIQTHYLFISLTNVYYIFLCVCLCVSVLPQRCFVSISLCFSHCYFSLNLCVCCVFTFVSLLPF